MGGEDKKMFKFELLSQLKRNYSLVPIFFIGVFGMSLSAFAIFRTLARSPDLSINRRGNPKPYDYLLTKDGKHQQYKYFSTMDYNKMEVDPDKPTLD